MLSSLRITHLAIVEDLALELQILSFYQGHREVEEA